MAVSAVGGYDYIFITDLPEDLVCTLCHLAFKNPLQIEECGHIFCKLCFDQMVEHAEKNSLDITCPLDRQKIDVSRVFKDKFHERKVLNLVVQCPNYGENCQWTGELREALEHENQCCKNITMLDKPLDDKLNQLLNQVRELDTNSKRHELQLVEKDKEIENQSKQIESLVKQMEDQEKKNVNHNKQMDNLVKQMEEQERKNVNYNKQIENLKKQREDQEINHNKQMENLNKQIEDQNKQIDNLLKEVRSPNQCQNNMIMQNVEDETNFYPICTTFQWKFKPTEIKSDDEKFCPPFYNGMNTHCFHLGVMFSETDFLFTLYRYRGKYDHHSNEIKVTNDIAFEIRIFGKNGELKVLEYSNADYPILKYQASSEGRYNSINKREIDSLTTDDGYVTLHCFFNKTT